MNDRPSGGELLAVARRALLDDLLPLLPADKAYDALMVAKAMAIAAREFDQGGTDTSGDQILRFYLSAGLGGEQDATERGLAAKIRTRAIPAAHHGLLHQLLLSLTRAKLAITNPRRLDK